MPQDQKASGGAILFGLALVLSIPVCFYLGGMLVMGSDECLGSYGPGLPLKCYTAGQMLIAAIPTGCAVVAVALAALAAMRMTRYRVAVTVAASLLPIIGLVISFQIAAQPLP